MTKRRTHEEYISMIRQLVGDEYTVLGTYSKSAHKIKKRHNICGHEWSITPNNFLRGKRCPKCANENKSKDTEVFRAQVATLANSRLTIIGDYTSCYTPIKVKCNVHGNEYLHTPSEILRDKITCKQCQRDHASLSQRKTEEEFKKQLLDKHRGRIVSVDSYINTHTKITFSCTVCSESFKAEPNSILRISGCPNCLNPKGEQAIRDYLKENQITFESQYKFPDCRYIKPLRFDFYLPERHMVIEYDGLQHYKPIEFFGGNEAFEKQQIKDNIKNEYARANDLEMVRITYEIKDTEIHKLLDSYLLEGKPVDDISRK